jgi:hypothetical protein
MGGLAPYVWSCWDRPIAPCPAPTWFWLRWIGLQGCGDGRLDTDGEGHARMPGEWCWAHPDSRYYIRLVSRLMGRGTPK